MNIHSIQAGHISCQHRASHLIMKNQSIKKPMHPADIKAEIEKAGITQRKIAEDCGKSISMVSMVISSEAVSKKVATAISSAIGKTNEDLWPGKYPIKEEAA